MTKKRFTTDNGSNEDVCLVDNVTGKEYESNFCDIVDLLNEQEETIQSLLKVIQLNTPRIVYCNVLKDLKKDKGMM